MSNETFLHLPAEVWLHILALATEDCSPVALACAEWPQYQPIVDPFSDIRHFWRDARSFSLVNKHWNTLGTDLLYGCVSVEQHFDMLHGVLARHGAAKLVRAVRLSSTRFDRNRIMLAHCPSVQTIVLPDVPPYADLPWISNSPETPLGIHFPTLKYIYWTETQVSNGLLRQLVDASPNLEGLYLGDTSRANERGYSQLGLPSHMPSLRRLSLGVLAQLSTSGILEINLRRLTSLTCFPAFIKSLPDLPNLRKAHIFGSRSVTDLNALLARCPFLDEIFVDVWNQFVPVVATETKVKSLSLIRVHSAVSVVRDWSHITQLFETLTSADFPVVRRIVLHNMWHRAVADVKFAPIMERLQERGCKLEFPEGHVLV